MTKEQIDNLYSLWKRLDNNEIDENTLINELLNMIEDENLKQNAMDKLSNNENNDFNELVIKRIINQIEEDDLYQYFEDECNKSPEVFTVFASKSSLITKDVVKKYLNDERLKMLSGENKTQFIIATEDKEFIKECIQDKNLELEEWNKVELIKTIDDKEFTKKCIYDENLGIYGWYKAELIKSIDNKEFMKKCIYDKDLGLDSMGIGNLIKTIGDKEFTKECIRNDNLKLDAWSKVDLIKNINDDQFIKYCIEDKKLDLNSSYKFELIKLVKDENFIKRCIQNEILELTPWHKIELIKLVKDEDFIKKCIKDKSLELNDGHKVELIKGINDKEFLKKCVYDESLGLDNYYKIQLIKSMKDQDFTKECIKDDNLKLNSKEKAELIISLKNKEFIKKCMRDESLGLNNYGIFLLIKSTEDKELIEQCIKDKSLNIENQNRIELIKIIKEQEKYISKDMIELLDFKGIDVVKIFNINDQAFGSFIDNELEKETYDPKKIIRMSEITEKLKNSNSASLARVSIETAMQVYELPLEEQEKSIEEIKKIYMTDCLPTVAKDFLVFKQLHPNLLGININILHGDSSIGNIPSLSEMIPEERSKVIFSDLLKANIESNNRNLKQYIESIEEGNKYFKMIESGEIQINDELPIDISEKLLKYSNILNGLYNQTSKGKILKEKRKNTGDLAKDLEELYELFKNGSQTNKELPDILAETFGAGLGIKNFEDIKCQMEKASKEIDKKNQTIAKKGKLTLEKGDFIKGIQNTEYIPRMLQSGILAKDYLGKSATSDGTPLDMDIELIVESGEDFLDTYDNYVKISKNYTNNDVSGRRMGKILLVFKNDGKYVKTREGYEIDLDAIDTLREDKDKKEFFDNNGAGGINAHGIRTGVGSNNISYIISDRYIDKLGLEIAMNGFYIPIVNEQGEIIFTPDMYNDIRSKMQGLSHYELEEFKLDETAKNEGTEKIIEIVEESKKEASYKRKMIMKELEKAISENGLEISPKRRMDLLPGIVEIIDTGSTGRGTNEPGDGDFDFMVRIDNEKINNPDEIKKIKESIKQVLSQVKEPKNAEETGKGDFRYKGVFVEGIEKSVDIDLTFTTRTDEIEYTTEECIKDRLETIKRNSPEDYKYVVANILLAKKVLKTEGAYKKKNAPEPETGKKDTRGGLGAVGIENWILQNRGSFKKAAENFLSVSEKCSNLEEFQKKYKVWDFGENYMADDRYPHDNFVYNMHEEGYLKMKNALRDYLNVISLEEKQEQHKKEIKDIVKEDTSVLEDSTYIMSVEALLEKARVLVSQER